MWKRRSAKKLIESSIDPMTNLEKDDRRIIFHTNKSKGNG